MCELNLGRAGRALLLLSLLSREGEEVLGPWAGGGGARVMADMFFFFVCVFFWSCVSGVCM